MLKMSDGPEGVRTWGPDTAYAGGIALAAAWDPSLANQMGESIGKDARARGVNFLLGPGVNIYRAPMNGRNFEYLGEDPYLSGQTAAAYIRGVQSEGVIATVKHFAANNEEYDRHNVSSDMDERTLREIYLPAFEAAVREGHVGAVMNSYNLLNGVHATQNTHLNLDILKGDWKFDGILMSDWVCHLLRRRRRQWRPRSRDALRPIHESEEPAARRQERPGHRSLPSTRNCAASSAPPSGSVSSIATKPIPPFRSSARRAAQSLCRKRSRALRF